jgi:hypothetical protein
LRRAANEIALLDLEQIANLLELAHSMQPRNSPALTAVEIAHGVLINEVLRPTPRPLVARIDPDLYM